jgi:hypothetical protein
MFVAVVCGYQLPAKFVWSVCIQVRHFCVAVQFLRKGMGMQDVCVM